MGGVARLVEGHQKRIQGAPGVELKGPISITEGIGLPILGAPRQRNPGSVAARFPAFPFQPIEIGDLAASAKCGRRRL